MNDCLWYKAVTQSDAFPYLLRLISTDGGKISDISLIAGKEFRNWMVKDLVPLSQVVSAIQKRRRKIVLSFSDDSVTTARLKTYNVRVDIGAHWARDQMG
ncbi:hypothetical protein TNCV_2728901 [Trichonephila clavipes]|nr:hypothetical protein TNCV_2728901 [Trichonephila clavipes]